MAKTPRNNGGNPIDAKVQRAVAKMIDTVLNTVVGGIHSGILARVRALSDTERLRSRLVHAASGLALDECDGAELADEIIDDIIETLRRKFPGQTRQALELLLADVRADAANRLGEITDGLVDRDQFINEVVSNLSDSMTGDPTPGYGAAP